MALRLLVVADDLTGAHDCAARLASLGGPIPTARDARFLRPARSAVAWVLDAETRFLKPAQARWRCAQAWAQLGQGMQAPWRFQKLDSTLRGNPGEEVEGLLQATAAPWVAVLPAYPRAGRLTLGGRHYVHGQPLEKSEFARDPLTPARAGRPQDLFQAAMNLHVPLAWVRSGAARLASKLGHALKGKPARVVTFDCATDAQVDHIAQAALRLGCRHFAGASALAGSLAKCLGSKPAQPALPPQGLPWMILAGSVSGRSFEQLGQAEGAGALAWASIQSRPSLAVLRAARRLGPLALSTLAGRTGIASAAEGERAIQRLVRTALQVLPDPSKAAWSLTGGHCALRFFEAAAWQRFDVAGEVLPGVALGKAWGPRGGAWVCTKPGGFGQVDLYSRLLQLVRAR
jgi:uncharacterized protein YgbK (DUF1537 family)